MLLDTYTLYDTEPGDVVQLFCFQPYAPNFLAARNTLMPRHGNELPAQKLNSLLTTAVAMQESDIVCALLQRGADPNWEDALTQAAQKDPESVNCLLKYGANVNERNGIMSRSTALMGAAVAHQVKTARLLIEHHADVNLVDDAGGTALTNAVMRKDLKMIDLLLKSGARLNIGTQPHTQPQRYYTSLPPLSAAVSIGSIDVMKALLSRGGDPKAEAAALSEAVSRGRIDLVRFLLAKGARPDVHSNQWLLAVQTVRAQHDARLLALLRPVGVGPVATKAEIEARNDTRQTPLLIALAAGNAEQARLLLAQGANVNVVDRSGYTPLMAAIEHCPSLIPDLLAKHATPNSVTSEG